MRPACDQFEAGDAVQMRDGIVHAGPKCDKVAGQPRVVAFATYRTRDTEHYNINYQYRIWDWAYSVEVPDPVAYARLQEVHLFSEKKKLNIEPWAYYTCGRSEACKMLCETPGLSPSKVRELVRAWRSLA